VVHLHHVPAHVDRPEERDAARHGVTLRSEQIPPVPLKVEKHGESAVGFLPRWRDKPDALSDHPLVVEFESIT
jgi:hypothetical protein